MEVSGSTLPHRVATASESIFFRQRLEELHDAVYRMKKGQSVTTMLQEHLLVPEYEHLTEYMKQKDVSSIDSKAVQGYIAATIAALDESKPLVCKMAFPVRHAFEQKLVEWFAEHMSGCVRITFEYAPDVMGGFVVEYEGRVYDQSLALQLSQGENLSDEQRAKI